jgi:hypothetical protein
MLNTFGDNNHFFGEFISDFLHIQVQAGTAYQLNAKDFDAKKSSLIAKKVGSHI